MRTRRYFQSVLSTCLFATLALALSANDRLVAADSIPMEPMAQTKQIVNKDSNNKVFSTVGLDIEKRQWQQFVPPRDTKYDWIQLISGEWLKGHLKFLYNYSLEFDSDELGLLKFDWEDVKQIRSADLQSIRIENGDDSGKQTTFIGVLNVYDGKASVTSGKEVVKFTRRQIVSIAEGTSSEADLWSGKLSLGINVRSGNSDLIDSSLIASARRRTAESRIIMDYVGNFSEAENIETSNNHRFNFQYDLFKSARFFWRPITGEYFRDTFKNIDHQFSLGMAFGYHFIRSSKTEWEVSGGAGVLYKRYVSVEQGREIDNVSPTASFGTTFDTEFTSWLDYMFDFGFSIVDQDSGEYIHHLISTLETDLISDLNLDISFVWDRIQEPKPAADGTIPKKDDFQLIVGIGYEF